MPKERRMTAEWSLDGRPEPQKALLPPKEAAPGWLEPSSRDVENHLTVAIQTVHLNFTLRPWRRYGASCYSSSPKIPSNSSPAPLRR
jgi:hypothetical protein